MLKMLLRFWPVLLPLLIYALWLWRVRSQARARGEDVPPISRGTLGSVIMLTLGLLILCFFWLGAANEPVKGTYIPAHMENGTLVPARIEK